MSLQALGARSGGEFATLEKIIIPRRPKEKRVDSHLLSGACLAASAVLGIPHSIALGKCLGTVIEVCRVATAKSGCKRCFCP